MTSATAAKKSKRSGLAATARPGVVEVARRAGVSVATVSRVLNDSPHVRPDTRARIQAALDDMRYMRNGAARALSSRRSRTIGLIVPMLGTAVFAEAAQAIQEALQPRKYNLLTATSGYDPARELDAARTMIEHGVDGLVLVGNNHLPALYDLVQQAEIPVVQTFVYYPKSIFPCVGFDNFKATYEIVDYLIDLGHCEFAILSSRLTNNDRINARFEGITQCLRDHGITSDGDLMVQVGFTIAEGRAGLRALRDKGRRFTALACTGDVIAVGALLEAQQQGIDVPGQLSITGFHDLDLASHMDPPLTTVHAPIREMGTTAVEVILARLAGEAPPLVCNLPTSIVMRKSVGPAPSQG
jgi:LacI family transcriptional regulator